MDIKYDAAVAERMVSDMSSYCSVIQEEALSLMQITSNPSKWNDVQYKTFCEKINLLVADLDQALRCQSDYINVYIEKINELRG